MKKLSVVLVSVTLLGAVSFASLQTKTKVKKEVKKEQQEKKAKKECRYTCPFGI
jgi:hypothetical protein